jgi:hypothetical protein
MAQRNVCVPQRRSQNLVHGVAATLRRLEREAAGLVGDDQTATAGRRLQTFQRSLARMLQQAHLESVQEPAVGQ